MSNVPTSTKWVRDSTGPRGRQAVDSVYMITNEATQSKGTGFAIEGGYLVTNQHVVDSGGEEDISVISAYDNKMNISSIYTDAERDIAILEPDSNLSTSLEIGSTENLKPGVQVSTWGYPLGYSGPAPILSVGYIAGFQEKQVGAEIVREVVVNGAFNNGNSGGPLFISGDDKVIGIVVSKHAPLTERQRAVLSTLQRTGGIFPIKDGPSLSQMIASWLTDLNQLTQVMIGHAIDIQELKKILDDIK